jgi:hypothetical protein
MSTRVMPRCTIDAGEVHDVLYPFVSLGADKFPREVTANDCPRVSALCRYAPDGIRTRATALKGL